MIESLEVVNDFEKKEEKIIQEHKEKKLQKRLRTSSANLHSKKHRKQNSSPTKGSSGSSNSDKGAKLLPQRSLSAKKPGLPLIFSEQRSNSNSLLPISALCWSVTDAVSGQQIYSKMSSEVREMASLTKMMTLYVCHQLSLSYNLNPELEEIVVPRIAAYTCGTSAFLRESEKLSLKDLYHALMLPSGNDAAVTLAHHFGQILNKNPLQLIKVRQQINSQQNHQSFQSQQQQYTQKQQSPERDTKRKSEKDEESQQNQQVQQNQETDQYQNQTVHQQQDQRKKSQGFISRFVKEMNKYASKLGMRDSQFSNPHGLASKSNRSTCEDLSKVALAIVQTPELQQICSTKSYSCIIFHTLKKDIRKAEWVNTNKLLWDESNQFFGVKTGCTDNAGPCLCVYYKDTQNVNIELIITVLCCKNPERRFEDSSKLARWAARKLNSAAVVQQQQQQQSGNQNKFAFYNPSNLSLSLNQKTILSKSIAFQQVSFSKNDLSQDRCLEKSDQNKQDKIQQLGRTISSFTQLNSFCNLNTSFISNNKIRSGNVQPTKESISPLLQYKDQNRINKFINSNISQIQNHHFTVNSMNKKDEQDLTDRSIIPPSTNRGHSETNQSSLMSTIQRDRSAKSFYNSNEKTNAIQLIKKRIDEKIQVGQSQQQQNKGSKSPTKIQKIISSINNNKNNIGSNTNQLGINSSQSICSTAVTSNQVSSTNKNYQDLMPSSTESIGNEMNNLQSSLLSPITTRSISMNTQCNFNTNIADDRQSNISPTFSSQNPSFCRSDNQNSQLKFLLKGGIQYRSEIRDSIKKPIGGNNSNVPTMTQGGIPQLEKLQAINDNVNNEEGPKQTNISIVQNNNNNHNIKIFSKSKKKRYIISCLANIN